VIHGLLGVELRDRGHNAEGVAREEDHVLWVSTDGGQLHIADMLERVADTRVRRQADIVVVDQTLASLILVVTGVLDDRAELDSIENIGLTGTRQAIGLGVATAFDVEDIGVGPDVLVITDEETLGVRRQGGLTSAGKTE